ncbi:tRNA (guanosine(46)-N7)-methyltransferase TrmB [Candidatus Vallotia cooleyia]|uniref:tRNA (guanosine(46)-N7)-methyltransferase TrmB n=1 Tax=Candidatus Vallotiella adelgis TaxID=1177211 RepID=UPI001D003FA1|nr:tRNA (guanosine(46)-N7)-methyltransferase TrmB [Candidatus Vallotia cooleyia]UDG82429.1 tRNA (guanine-N(7)-)-methyltransferase [Candidatus Vallotia cooleyia]
MTHRVLNYPDDNTPNAQKRRCGVGRATNVILTLQHIPSFVTRARRLSTAQKQALDELSPQFKLPYTGVPIDWEAIFRRNAPRLLEIGFGMGATTADIAEQRPMEDFLGIEVYEPGVGALLRSIRERRLSNIRIIQHDAVEVIKYMLDKDTVDGVHVFFPDPWPKKRHHKRRLIQPLFIKLLASRLRAGGYLHLATDWQNYAEQMLNVLLAEPELVNQTDEISGYMLRPNCRPVTKFEQRGLELGHSVWDLVFTRRIKNSG